LAGIFASTSLYNVDAGTKGIIFDKFRGVLPKSFEEGTHVKIPMLQKAYLFETRCQPKDLSTFTGTKDLQNVNINLRVLFRPMPDKIQSIFLNYGHDYESRVLPSIANEVLKSIVAQYNASQLIINRDEVSNKIREELAKRGEHFHILFDDISITHIGFTREFTDAVEKKQIAQQEAERAKYTVEKAIQEKKAAIIKASGDADSAKLLQDAFTKCGTGLIEFRKIEACEEIVSNLANSKKVHFLPSSKNMLLNLGLDK